MNGPTSATFHEKVAEEIERLGFDPLAPDTVSTPSNEEALRQAIARRERALRERASATTAD